MYVLNTIFNLIIKIVLAQIQLLEAKSLKSTGIEIMINNAPLSQIHLIQQLHSKHKRRLEKIIQSKPKSYQYTMSNNFLQMLQTRRVNHENWRQFNRNKQRAQLLTKNEKMFNKLIDITAQSSPYSQEKLSNQTFYKRSENSQYIQNQSNDIQVSNSNVSYRLRSSSLHHNYQLENLRKIKAIDEQNPKLAQRIIQKTGFMSHIKDEQQFRKTRQIMNRLCKFDQIKRAINHTKILQKRGSSQIKIRAKTLSNARSKPKNQITNIKIEDDQNQQYTQYNKNRDKNASYNFANLQQQLKFKVHQDFRSRKVDEKRYKTIESIREQTQGSQQFNKTRKNQMKRGSKLKTTSKQLYQSDNQNQLLQSYLNNDDQR